VFERGHPPPNPHTQFPCPCAMPPLPAVLCSCLRYAALRGLDFCGACAAPKCAAPDCTSSSVDASVCSACLRAFPSSSSVAAAAAADAALRRGR
jgi:hypothetical protein